MDGETAHAQTADTTGFYDSLRLDRHHMGDCGSGVSQPPPQTPQNTAQTDGSATRYNPRGKIGNATGGSTGGVWGAGTGRGHENLRKAVR